MGTVWSRFLSQTEIDHFREKDVVLGQKKIIPAA